MALASVNAQYENDDNFGARTVVRHPKFTIGTYLTGGVVSLKGLAGLTQIVHVNFLPTNAAARAYTFSYDFANDKVIVFSSGSQVSDATDLSGVEVQAQVFGY